MAHEVMLRTNTLPLKVHVEASLRSQRTIGESATLGAEAADGLVSNTVIALTNLKVQYCIDA
jgi:hypothetical protein